MSNARKIADLLDSSGDVKSTHLDNTSSDLVDDTSPQLGGNLDTNGNALDTVNLEAYNDTTSITDNAVDIFIYDTSKDSDGGAWRKRCQHLSWYNEGSSSTRGSRKEFPAVAVIVVESNKVTIYDGDTPDLDMWMIFDTDASSSDIFINDSTNVNTSVSMVNSLLLLGSTRPSTTGNLGAVSFLLDMGGTVYTSTTDIRNYKGSIEQRHDALGSIASTSNFFTNAPIINRDVNDIAMTVLPNAPIDSATGLPIPTIAVATNSGTSIIRDDGTVANYKYTWTTVKSSGVGFGNQAFSQMMHTGYSSAGTGLVVYDYVGSGDSASSNLTGTLREYHNSTVPSIGVGSSTIGKHEQISDTKHAIGNVQYMALLDENTTTPSKGSVAYITSKYNTGYMTGDIRGAWLSDTDATDVVGSTNLITAQGMDGTITGDQGSVTLSADKTYKLTITTVGSVHLFWRQDNASSTIAKSSPLGGYALPTGTSTTYITGITSFDINSWNTGTISSYAITEVTSDRSVNSKPLNVHGTVDKDAVATGAELVGYSGFTTSDYLMQPYNSDLDFGTGDFSVMGWAKSSTLSSGVNRICGRADGVNSHRLSLYCVTGSIFFYTNASGSYTQLSTAISNDEWHYITITRQSGSMKIYLEGVEKNSTTASHDLTSTSNAPFILGAETFDFGATIDSPFNGSLALWRVSATAPSAEQIKDIYEAEKPMFQENAKCTLNGSSDAVTAMDYDDSNDELLVGTSGGLSVFKGLRRVDENTNNISEVAQQGGLRVEEY